MGKDEKRSEYSYFGKNLKYIHFEPSRENPLAARLHTEFVTIGSPLWDREFALSKVLYDQYIAEKL